MELKWNNLNNIEREVIVVSALQIWYDGSTSPHNFRKVVAKEFETERHQLTKFTKKMVKDQKIKLNRITKNNYRLEFQNPENYFLDGNISNEMIEKIQERLMNPVFKGKIDRTCELTESLRKWQKYFRKSQKQLENSQKCLA